jgi:hypothetical protein
MLPACAITHNRTRVRNTMSSALLPIHCLTNFYLVL